MKSCLQLLPRGRSARWFYCCSFEGLVGFDEIPCLDWGGRGVVCATRHCSSRPSLKLHPTLQLTWRMPVCHAIVRLSQTAISVSANLRSPTSKWWLRTCHVTVPLLYPSVLRLRLSNVLKKVGVF